MNMNRSRNPPPPTTITMTGTTITTTGTGTTTSGSKKKFGKNLNKLIKQKQQPTTPQINGLNSRSNGQSHGYSYRSISGSSLNHGGGVQMQTLGGGTGTGGGTSNLVLLSTKKKRATSGSSMLGMSISKSNGSGSNNVGNGASKNASSAGMTTGGTAHTATTTATASASASKSKSLLTSSSKVSSTHGALVNALNGSNRNGNGHHNMNGINNGHGQNFDYQNGDSGSHSAPPVAWGIEKVTNQKQSQQPQQQQQSYGDEKNVHYQQQQNNGTSHSKSPQQQQSQKSDNENQQTSPQPKSTSTSSQSTSKTPKATTAKNEEECKEDQVEFMKKLAKEKAMKMRQEEENRIQQQKERAALRLKELELKMAKKSSANDNVNANSQPKRSLYDPTSTTTPSRTYSSLVGNHNHNNVPVKSSHHGNTNANGNGNGNVNSSDNHINGYGKESYNQHQHPPPTISTTTEMTSSSTNAPPMPMIHLSSYDDRDRGMVRSANSGPRMLFDPKSGSMVAVTSRDENKSGTGDNGNSGGNGDRERGGSSKGRREKGKSKSSRLRKDVDNNGGADEDGMDIKSNKLRNKSKKEKRREEKKRIKNDLERRRKSITSSTQERNTNGNNHEKRVRIPRTKGVLYKRDEKGNLVSADGCEGDQGYGAHSVAGGRIRNPKGYMALKKKLQEENEKYSRNFPDTPNNQEFIGWHQQYDYPGQSTAHIEYEPILAKTLNRSHFMRKSSSPKQNTEKIEEINIGLPTPVRITADEKLELLTGMDESPTLQATAAAWAPSEAALALAAANVNQNEKDSNNSKSSDDNSETDVNALENAMALIDSSNHGLSDDEGSESLRYGLGFDPKDMDAVMMSPDFISTDNNISDSAIVPDLIFKADNPVTTSSKNPFATDTLLGTSPWGGKVPNSVSMGSLTNWDYLNTKVPKESTTDMSPDNTRAKSFLSLSGLNGDTNTWGTGGGFVSGFNGIDGPLFGSSHTKSTKD